MRYGQRLFCTVVLTALLTLGGCWGKGKDRPKGQHTPRPPVSGVNATFDLRLSLGTATTDQADIFLLFDDTGSFSSRAPSVIALFPTLVEALLTAFPDIDFGFGVGRYEDYSGRGWGSGSSDRPLILNQPIIRTARADFDSLLSAALSRAAPGGGGDGPETGIDALYQVATGVGLDGDGNGSALDSGVAGAVETQTSPGTSGDVPPFSSNVAPTDGTLGGVGWRTNSLKVVIMATDVMTVSPFHGTTIPTMVTGSGGSVPAAAFAGTSTTPGENRFGFVGPTKEKSTSQPGAVAPLGAGGVQQTIDALNALGILVVGLSTQAAPVPEDELDPDFGPSTHLTALAILTGARDSDGTPLVFQLGATAEQLSEAIGDAIEGAITREVDVILTESAVPTGVTVSETPGVRPGVGPGGNATFRVTVRGDVPAGGNVVLTFRDQASNGLLGTAVLRFPSRTSAALDAGSSPNVSIP